MPPEWDTLVYAIMAGLMPVIGSCGIAIGRMQVTDEIDRGESPKYVRRNVPSRIIARRHRTVSIMEDA